MITSTDGAARLIAGDVLDLRDAAAYLRRLLRIDRGALVRLRSAGSVVAIFAQPLGVLAMRTMGVVGSLDLDRTVRAGELVAALDEADAQRSTVVDLPAARDAEWAGTLPTAAGWSAVAVVPGDLVRGIVDDAAARFRTATDELADVDRTPEAFETLAQRHWDRDVLTAEYDGAPVGLSMRLFAAARTLGFLAPDDPVELRISAGWLRLDATFGAVYLRRATGLAAFGLSPG